MRRFLTRTALDRAAGKRPAPPRAAAAALAVGGAAAVVTYRLLRHETKR
jgi:hypothetical protein